MSAVGTHSLWRDAAEFKACARAWAEKIGVRPSRIQVQTMTRKWASCSTAGTLSFSRDLLHRDRNFGEAVIVHELIHLRVRNHGRLFRSLFRAYLPEAEKLLNGGLHCGVTEPTSPR